MLGFAPQPREFLNGRQFQNMIDMDFTLTNNEYELSMIINRTHWEDDQTGLIRQRFSELGEVWGSFKDNLFAQLLAAGSDSGNNSFDGTTFAELPFKFEAGTPHIAGIIAMGAAVDYVGKLGFEGIEAHEAALLAYATERIGAFNNIRIIGTARDKAAIISFVIDDVHLYDAGTILDRELARYLANEVTAEQALANIEAGWEEITEEFGRDEQLSMYKASLGISN